MNNVDYFGESGMLCFYYCVCSNEVSRVGPHPSVVYFEACRRCPGTINQVVGPEGGELWGGGRQVGAGGPLLLPQMGAKRRPAQVACMS